MGRVKEAVLASLAHPIVSSGSALWSLSSPAFSYIDHKIRQNIYTPDSYANPLHVIIHVASDACSCVRGQWAGA